MAGGLAGATASAAVATFGDAYRHAMKPDSLIYHHFCKLGLFRQNDKTARWGGQGGVHAGRRARENLIARMEFRSPPPTPDSSPLICLRFSQRVRFVNFHMIV
jgi:hypothetical protein